MTNLALLELERLDWSGYQCGCGESAEHLKETFRELLDAESAETVPGRHLENHLEVSGLLFRAAPEAVPVLVAALGEDLPRGRHRYLLTALWHLVAGDSHRSETEAGQPDLGDECREQARQGLWLYYDEALHGDTGTALDILELVEDDEERLEHFREAVRPRLEKQLRRRLC
ncbi:hypothetical protein E0500_015165 [Streptomyces sp. KM273126]|uniref:hypothetical protein n=1 Tax=Streptomyces sp. KM273126 TaxID=2545247 RepID=UPI001039636D|nr:hypothetical protein [Streptomyces sp. KM273126]MBA2808701.1 hypothetical protein [Streptomyces sp. KM273126]